jgi:hypothetical protein
MQAFMAIYKVYGESEIGSTVSANCKMITAV